MNAVNKALFLFILTIPISCHPNFLHDLGDKIDIIFKNNRDFKSMHSKIMDYPIPRVLARYKKDYNVSDELALIHEKELKRYFILCGTYPNESLDMFSPEVDNLWHTFILYTKDYEKFCHEIFGYFLHHCPTK